MSTYESAYNRLGLLRLGRAIAKSFEIQNISYRHASHITKSIFGMGVNKDTIGRMVRGVTDPEQSTLQRLAPLVFTPSGFKCLNDTNDVGDVILSYQGGEYGFDKRTQLLTADSLDKLPDLNYRCMGWQDLQKIIDGDTPIRVYFINYSPKI